MSQVPHNLSRWMTRRAGGRRGKVDVEIVEKRVIATMLHIHNLEFCISAQAAGAAVRIVRIDSLTEQRQRALIDRLGRRVPEIPSACWPIRPWRRAVYH